MLHREGNEIGSVEAVENIGMHRFQFDKIQHIMPCSQCNHKNATIRKFTGTSEEETKVYKAKNYVLATGVNSYRIGKQVGVTIPVYPLRGNLVTIPINVCIYKIFIILQLNMKNSGYVNNNSPNYCGHFQTDKLSQISYGIYSTGVGCVICPIPGDKLRVSSEVHAVGFDHRYNG